VRLPMKRIALAVIEYALGFLALATFAALAFGQGKPTDERLVWAFKVCALVAAVGERRRVLACSLALLAAVAVALASAIYFRGDVKFAAVLPVIALSWLGRLLRRVAATKT
jgi:hypothetical protein